MFDELRKRGFDVTAQSHAQALLKIDFPFAEPEITDALTSFYIDILELVKGGGGEAPFTKRLRLDFSRKNWLKHNFEIKKLVDGAEKVSTSHEIDHVRKSENGTIALEIEWNNKDPFYDRDLENFKRLHAETAISIGVIVTRGSELQHEMSALITKFADERNVQSYEDLKHYGVSPTDRQRSMVKRKMEKAGLDFRTAWVSAFCSDKFGQATTHWRKLEDRISRGVGNPCPLLLIGLPASVVRF